MKRFGRKVRNAVKYPIGKWTTERRMYMIDQQGPGRVMADQYTHANIHRVITDWCGSRSFWCNVMDSLLTVAQKNENTKVWIHSDRSYFEISPAVSPSIVHFKLYRMTIKQNVGNSQYLPPVEAKFSPMVYTEPQPLATTHLWYQNTKRAYSGGVNASYHVYDYPWFCQINDLVATVHPPAKYGSYENVRFNHEHRTVPLTEQFPNLSKYVTIKVVKRGTLDYRNPPMRFSLKNPHIPYFAPLELMQDGTTPDLTKGVAHFYFMRAYAKWPLAQFPNTGVWNPAEAGSVYDTNIPCMIKMTHKRVLGVQLEGTSKGYYQRVYDCEDGWNQSGARKCDVGYQAGPGTIQAAGVDTATMMLQTAYGNNIAP